MLLSLNWEHTVPVLFQNQPRITISLIQSNNLLLFLCTYVVAVLLAWYVVTHFGVSIYVGQFSHSGTMSVKDAQRIHLINAFRRFGHLRARLDPLGLAEQRESDILCLASRSCLEQLKFLLRGVSQNIAFK